MNHWMRMGQAPGLAAAILLVASACGGGGGSSGNGSSSTSTTTTTTGGAQAATLAVAAYGAGTITSQPTGVDCTGSCSTQFTVNTAVLLLETPATGYTFAGWNGACTGTGSCSVLMSSTEAVSATFSNTASNGCSQTGSSITHSSTGKADYTWWGANTQPAWGNLVVTFQDWGPDPGTLSEWVNSPACWGFSTTNTVDSGSPRSYPSAFRGWSNNGGIMEALSSSSSWSAGAPNWTTLSGMGIQVSALTKAHAKWSMTVPTTQNTNNTVARWDALMDIYLHTVPNPAYNGGHPQIDLQIYQMLMDQPYSGQPANESGYYANFFGSHHPFLKTFSGVQYVGVIDAISYNASGGHTITMVPTPTMYTNPGTTGLLWGVNSVVHDVGGIITWLSQSNPTDDSGNPIMNASGTVVTTPVIDPSLYLTAINAGFEVNFGTAPGNNLWSTTDFWVAMQNEPDGL